ncbi:fructotransferase [Microbacterium sp. CSI-V]|uniref:NosD domain-containing protein n=1 Tax=unclassified Microbacterium TaxID=2609290 RepID=UPI00097BABF9|nr:MULTISPECIES: NosD domain-containing protein [unclassified Microbacterium]MXS75628.1 fructotransferase [Microbacterium sp. TL13]ONI64733.1 fructotransferase [Microbacterium sp. CSI-V]
MPSAIYDVTTWTIPSAPTVTASTDIGAVINSIIADIKSTQTSQASKPGAVIYIPPGDYSLKTRAVIDISYLQIKGSGHGFTSSSIRYNAGDTSSWWEIFPGGSRIRVENTDGNAEAFLIQRSGSPRLSSIEFIDFCLDGVSFTPNQNSYTNGKIGIRSTSDTDSLRIAGMGLVYLQRGLVITGADALAVTNNFIAECGSCIELVASGQASLVSGNLVGAGPYGFSIFAEGHFGLLISGNNVFPRGKSSVHLKNCGNSSVTANRLHSFFSGMITTEGTCDNNLISSNHFLRNRESFPPFQSVPAPQDDLFGLIHVRGSGNTVVTNHFSFDVPPANVLPSGAVPTMVLVKSGSNNYLAMNHHAANVAVRSAVLDGSTTNTKVLDSGTTAEFQALGAATYGFRATP